MLLTIKAMTAREQVVSITSRPTTQHVTLSTRLSSTLAFDILQSRHFVGNSNKTIKYVTTAEEGKALFSNGRRYTVSADGLSVAILRDSSVVTPLYTNPDHATKLNELRDTIAKPKCQIYIYDNDGEAYTKRRTLTMSSRAYKQIILTDNGEYLIGLVEGTDSIDNSIEIYKRLANTYKLVSTTNISNEHINRIARKNIRGSKYTTASISSIGLMDDYLGIILTYKASLAQTNWRDKPTESLLTISLVDLIEGTVDHVYTEPLNYRVTSGKGGVNYSFVGNVAVCCIQDFTRESPIHDVYIFDKMLMIVHSVSLDYLLKQPSKSIVLDIPPYTPDNVTLPITLTL